MIVRKVNIATASFDAAAQKAAAYLSQPDANYFGMSSAMVEGTYENVKKHLRVKVCLDAKLKILRLVCHKSRPEFH